MASKSQAAPSTKAEVMGSELLLVEEIEDGDVAVLGRMRNIQ